MRVCAWCVWLILVVWVGLPRAAAADDLDKLCEAAMANAVSKVKRLLAKVDVKDDSCVTDGITDCQAPRALHCAARSGALEAAKAIVAAGADVNATYTCHFSDKHTYLATGWPSCTPLMSAAAGKNPELVRWLVKQGAKLEQVVDDLTPLHIATYVGDTAMIEMLLRLGAKADAPGVSQYTPLVIAIRQGAVDAVKLLVEKKAKVNTQPGSSTPPLMWAVLGGSVELVQYLLSVGADANVPDREGLLPLRRALDQMAGDGVAKMKPIVEALIPRTHDRELIDQSGETALTRAASGNLVRLELLIKSGFPINAHNRRGETALHIAIRTGDPEHVRLLLSAGADINAAGIEGKTPLMDVLYNWKSEKQSLLDLLLKAKPDLHRTDKKGRAPLHYALLHSDLVPVRMLLDCGADVNQAVEDGTTPLMLASSLEMLKLLLERGAHIEAADRNGWTALLHVAESGEELVTELLFRGANATYTTKDGWTLLTVASLRGYPKLVRELLRRKIDIHAKAQGARLHYVTDKDWTALALASIGRRAEIVELLLQAGADPNTPNGEGMTPVILCVQPLYSLGFETVRTHYPDPLPTLKLLLDRGAKIDHVDARGMTALMWAADAGQAKTVEFLLSRGADPTRRNAKGATAYSLAERGKSPEAMRLLPKLPKSVEPAEAKPQLPPAAATAQPAVDQTPPGRFPFSSQRLITKEELARYSMADLKEMRNEIYARHGRPFKSVAISEHFRKQPWYKPDPGFSESLLSEIERKNLTIILSVEKQGSE